MNSIYLDDVPTNAQGKFSRKALLSKIGFKNWIDEKRSFVSIYCGSSPGNHPEYVETAILMGELSNNQGWVCVNGGGTNGLMVASNSRCERTISFTTRVFSVPDESAENKEGLNPHGLNVINPDYFERKVCMDILSDVCFVLAGGLGSLDEAFEAIIFAQKANRKVVFVNTRGIWNPLMEQLKKWDEKGLMPKEYKNNIVFTKGPYEAIDIAKKHINHIKSARMDYSETPKPPQSLRAFLANNNGFLPNQISSMLHNFGALATEVPRVALVASGNIGHEDKGYNFENKDQRDEICGNTAQIGYDLARTDALAIIPGTNEGLRKIVADKALTNGGRIIWVKKGDGKYPIEATLHSEREMTLTVPRQFEVDRLTTLLSTSVIAVCGGIHTADRVFGFLTRNQTGHGCYTDLLPKCDKGAPRPIIHCYSPTLGNGEGFWAPLDRQLKLCVDQGFAKKENLRLITSTPTTSGLVADAIEASWPKDGHDVPTNLLAQMVPSLKLRTRMHYQTANL